MTVRTRHPEMDHGEFPKEAALTEPGRYVAEGVGMGGEWRVAVDVLLLDRIPLTLFVTVDLSGLS